MDFLNIFTLIGILAQLKCADFKLQDPGIKIAVTDGGMDFACKQATNLITTKIKDLEFEQISKDYSFSYTSVDPLLIHTFEKPDCKISSLEIEGLLIQLRSIEASAHVEFLIKFFGVEYYFSAEVSISDMSLDLNLFMENSNGILKMDVMNCKIDGNLDITFDKDFNWMMNKVMKKFKSDIISLIYAQICTAIKNSGIAKANEYFASTSMIFSYEQFSLDAKLVRYPWFNAKSFETKHVGTVFPSASDLKDIPVFEKIPMPDTIIQSDKMFYIFLNDYVFNTALYTAFEENMLKIKINETLLPAENKQIFELILTMISPEYATWNLEIDIQLIEYPLVKFYQDSLGINASSIMKLIITNEDISIMAAIIQTNLSINTKFLMKDSKLKLHINSIQESTIVIETEFPNFSNMIKYGMKSIMNLAITNVNAKEEDGYVLPLPAFLNATEVNIIPSRNDGILCIAVDFPDEFNLIIDKK